MVIAPMHAMAFVPHGGRAKDAPMHPLVPTGRAQGHQPTRNGGRKIQPLRHTLYGYKVSGLMKNGKDIKDE